MKLNVFKYCLLGFSGFLHISCGQGGMEVPDLQYASEEQSMVIDSLETLIETEQIEMDVLIEYADAVLEKHRMERLLYQSDLRSDRNIGSVSVEILERAVEKLKNYLEPEEGSAEWYATFGRLYLDQYKMGRPEHRDVRREQAIESLNRALALDSTHVEVMLDLADLYSIRRSTDEELKKAEELVKRAVELEPENGLAYVRLGKVYQSQSGLTRMDNATRMVEAYQRAIELGVDDAEVYLDMAYAYRRITGAAALSEYSFDRSFQNVPDFIKGYFFVGMNALSVEDEDRVIRLVNEAVHKHPGYPLALLELASYYVNSGDYDIAADFFLTAIESNPDFVAYQLYSQYRNQLRADFLQKVLNRRPDNFHIHLMLAKNLQDRFIHTDPDYPAAIDHFKRALEIEPDRGEIILMIGHSYKEMEKMDEADEYYRASLEKPWNQPEYIIWIQEFYAEQGDLEMLLSISEKLEEIYPDAHTIQADGMAAFFLSEMNRTDLALDYIIQAKVRAYPDAQFEYSLYMVRIHLEDEYFDQALAVLNNISEWDLTHSEERILYSNYAEVYSMMGNYQDAIENYRMALELDLENDNWLHHRLAEELWEVGEESEAIEHFRIAADDGLPAARARLQELENRAELTPVPNN